VRLNQPSKSKLHYFADRKSTLISVTALLCAFALGVITGIGMPKHAETPQTVAEHSKVLQLKESRFLPVEMDADGHLVIDDGKKASSNVETAVPKPIVNTAGFFSENTGRVRTFHFPKNVSLGMINSHIKPLPEFTEMRGDVTLCAPIIIKVNDVFLNNPELYSKFRNDDVGVLNFGATKADIGPLLSLAAKGEKLESIGFWNCGADGADLKILEGMSKLSRLDIYASKIAVEDLLAFKRLHQLVWVGMGTMKGVKPLLKELTKSPILIHVGCSGCDIDLDDLKTISSMKLLTSVDLTKDKCVTDRTLPILLPARNLGSFDLEGCDITAASIPTFRQFKRLSYIRLTDSQFEEGSKSIQFQYARAFPQVTFMWKYGNPPDLFVTD